METAIPSYTDILERSTHKEKVNVGKVLIVKLDWLGEWGVALHGPKTWEGWGKLLLFV